MRIGIDARMYGPEQTGIGTYIQHLVEGVTQQDSVNEYVIFLLPAVANHWRPPRAGVKIVAVPAHWYSWREQWLLPLKLWQHSLDLVHFPHFNTPVFWRGRQIVTIHDVTPKFFPGHKMNSAWRQEAFNLTYRQTLQKARLIIAVSQHTKG